METTSNLQVWVPAIVSIVTLVINLMFYMFVQPRLTYKAGAKEALGKIAIDLLNYLSDIVSYECFDGVPTQIRKYSLQIHMQFKSGTADEALEELLEEIFKDAKARKQLTTPEDIDAWNNAFRVKVRKLRGLLAKYCGVL